MVDSEKIMARLSAGGWEVVHDSDQPAEVVVINTCGFIGDAKQESIDTILSCVQAKNEGLIERLYVIGCLSERYRDELAGEIPEVDEYFGARDFTGIVRTLGCAWNTDLVGERKLTTPPHYAYLKISEGCDRRCGFCAIPLIRGPHVSVPMEELEAEARILAGKGVRELMVIAQDTTYYGLDLYGERKLGELLTRLCRVEGIEWIRLHYAYPAGFPDDVIEAMAREDKICDYLDIPLQHISDSQLRSMKRGNTMRDTYGLIEKLRDRIPGIALRTTLLTGYPGETEEDFRQLEDFVRKVRFDRLGVFAYSSEEGTYSGEELTDDVPDELKHRRAERIMEIQREISRENNLARVGRTETVIVDREEDGMYVCRGRADSPEVDQEIFVDSGGASLRPGDFTVVEITSAGDYELFGRLAGIPAGTA